MPFNLTRLCALMHTKKNYPFVYFSAFLSFNFSCPWPTIETETVQMQWILIKHKWCNQSLVWEGKESNWRFMKGQKAGMIELADAFQQPGKSPSHTQEICKNHQRRRNFLVNSIHKQNSVTSVWPCIRVFHAYIEVQDLQSERFPCWLLGNGSS